ncbi:hypothetical protein ILYODFUR_028763 [Ilyodon furcidens]|uniref:Uncharacterized protein n=1 Tax=Ilyodon furcidens TaxID=33524 RepID=A0ABV0U9D5_9TELE
MTIWPSPKSSEEKLDSQRWSCSDTMTRTMLGGVRKRLSNGQSVKQGDGTVMLWQRLVVRVDAVLHKVDGIVKKENFLLIVMGTVWIKLDAQTGQ